MDAFTLLQNLNDRGFAVWLKEGRLHVTPSKALTTADKHAISANLPALKHLLAYEYTMYAEGWQQCHAIPERAVHVRQGYLLDSCLFRTPEGARDFVRRARSGEPTNLAFSAACAMEDTPTRSIFDFPQTEKDRARPRAKP